MKNKSETFNNWCKQVDKILSELPEHTIQGQPMEYSDDEFQNTMRKLQQCSLKFDEMPIYIINEKIASEVCYDHLKGMEGEQSDH